jgi:hypothetical protein
MFNWSRDKYGRPRCNNFLWEIELWKSDWRFRNLLTCVAKDDWWAFYRKKKELKKNNTSPSFFRACDVRAYYGLCIWAQASLHFNLNKEGLFLFVKSNSYFYPLVDLRWTSTLLTPPLIINSLCIGMHHFSPYGLYMLYSEKVAKSPSHDLTTRNHICWEEKRGGGVCCCLNLCLYQYIARARTHTHTHTHTHARTHTHTLSPICTFPHHRDTNAYGSNYETTFQNGIFREKKKLHCFACLLEWLAFSRDRSAKDRISARDRARLSFIHTG